MPDKKIIIAIDGYSSCGKSTLARDLARKLGYRYIDTGAMYRGVTLYFLRHKISYRNEDQVSQALEDIHIDFEYDQEGRQILLLNGENVGGEIRSREVSDQVSQVSTIKEVRDYLVKQQQKLGGKKGIVMDGRDIGTTVFPNAELKIFMTADDDVRVLRRHEELNASGVNMTAEEVRTNLKRRDYIDTHREESPLRQAEDAVVIDNTELSTEDQLNIALEMALAKTLSAAKS